MYKVRFHLAKGPNFGHWQIRSESDVIYVDPSKFGLLLWRCKLINKPNTAKKIFDGANKQVCAWIECCDYAVCDTSTMPCAWIALKFNPKKFTHWYSAFDNSNIDNFQSDIMYTYGRNIFAKGC